MAIDPTIGSLILAASSFLLAITYVVKKTKLFQLGTCCKLSVEVTPRQNPTAADIAQVIVPENV